MTRSGFIGRALLAAAVGLAIGHLTAVMTYQRQRLDELGTRLDEPALVEHWQYQSLVERRAVAFAAWVVLVCLAAGSARSVAEGVLLLLNACSLAGAAAAAELWALGYERILWPLVPADVSFAPSAVLMAHLAAAGVVAVVYASALRALGSPTAARKRGASRKRKPRVRPHPSGRHPLRSDEGEPDESP